MSRGATSRESTAAPRRPRPALPARGAERRLIPRDADTVEVRAAGRAVTLTNLRKLFWPELGLTKGDLLQYYVDVAPVLLPAPARPRHGDEALSGRRRRRRSSS